ATLLTMKPTTIAEIENRKKNEEPSRPNCSGSSFNSVMIGTPARPTTILSAKFTSMNRNSRNVIFQAPSGVRSSVSFDVPLGVGCAAMTFPIVSFVDPVDRAKSDAIGGIGGNATEHFRAWRAAQPDPTLRIPPVAVSNARNTRITIASSHPQPSDLASQPWYVVFRIVGGPCAPGNRKMATGSC